MVKNTEDATFQLAVMRTELSNSRTLLSHTQAAIGLMISGVAFMKLLDSFLLFDLCGWFFLLLSAGTISRGIYLYRKTKNQIAIEKTVLSRSNIDLCELSES